MELITCNDSSNEYLGDLYYGYFIPTVICGRTTSFQYDLLNFISNYTIKTFNSNNLEDLNDLGLDELGLEFRNCMLSKLLVVSPRESLIDVWYILWGVWSKILINEPSSDEYSDDYNLFFKSNVIFLMFYIYHCQSGKYNLPIPLSLETFDECLDIGKCILDRYSITIVIDVIDFMIHNNCIIITLFDGIQYYHINKYGKLLKPKVN